MSTRQTLVFSFLDRYSGLVIHTVSAMVIARLLTPAETGVYSVVMVLLGFVAVFRDFGAGQYLVQHRDASPHVLRATWTMQFGLGLLFAVAVLAGARPLARFYDDPRMAQIMYVLALNFLATPFLAFPNALLVRAMEFRTIALIRFVGGLGHASVAIGLAFSGHGPVSLAWANLGTTLIGITLTALLTKLPLWQRPTTRRLGEVLGFGGGMTVSSLLNTARTGAPELLLSKLQGLAEAGLLSRAQGLVAMFSQLVLDAVGSVALPYFSREVRAGNDLGKPFIYASEMVLGIGWAFFGVLALLAFPIVRLLYGLQWDESVLPVRWLALAVALSLPGASCFAPMLAVGALRDVVRASAVTAMVSIAAAAVGARYGVVAVAQLQVPVGAVTGAYWLWLTQRRIGMPWRDLAVSAGRSAAVAAGAMAAPLGAVLLLGWRPAGNPFVMLSCLPVAGLMLALAACATRHALWIEIENLLPMLRQRLRWRNN